MSDSRVVLLTLLALLAFAGNSLLCRIALAHTNIDAASFTAIRLVSGAVVLWALVMLRNRNRRDGAKAKEHGNWLSALALFVYAAGFSFAYIQLNTGIGALILFGAVQTSMIAFGLWRGERFTPAQSLGLLLACSGLIGLLLPGLSAPPLTGTLIMLAAGVAWGVYSLRGKGAGDPLQVTAGNFGRTVPMALLLSVLLLNQVSLDSAGMFYALLSGAVTSGMGYAIWYSALPLLKATTAATVQLSVPLLAALAGVLLLQEPLTLRLVLASLAILGGIALVLLQPKSSDFH
ncbi:DMT family transporter [Rheinheimera maricola]|uniref:DMT family transporter n=1 Tax=Rheinheimera maricola TaxID=2793282 RepID=A0ABS7X7K1_9GAMM|nr:DMT family transporter [Rheinheimera maricola]MBZ9611512.1 DMT family transporter [Rheinheimera maricola]